MRRTPTARRGGFTLVELLVVVSILAVLASIAAFAFLRVRGSAEVDATNATLQKVKSSLDRRWRAVLDDAAKDASERRIPAEVLAFAGGDPDRARVVWTYCKLRNEFPTTIQEACNPVTVPVYDYAAGTFGTPAAVLQPKAVFTAGFKVQGKTAVQGTAPTPPLAVPGNRLAYESAACLYWGLTQTATRGEAQDGDGINQQSALLQEPLAVTFTGAPAPPPTFQPRVFVDAYGNPLAFLRLGYTPGDTAELNAAPYTKLGANTNRDPIDPQGRLLTPSGLWTTANVKTLADRFWLTLSSGHASLDGAAYKPDAANDYPRTTPGDTAGTLPRGAWNWTPVVLSFGPNKALEPNLGQGDDLLSFRLARDGKGN